MTKKININTGNEKNVAIALLLWFFLGFGFGAHNYYLNRFGIGIAQLILFVIGVLTFLLGIGIIILIGLGIWWLVDLIYVFKYTDSSTVISLNSSSNINQLDELEKLHNLFEKGVITKEEFDNKKQKIIENY